jgi:hypothetical protein
LFDLNSDAHKLLSFPYRYVSYGTALAMPNSVNQKPLFGTRTEGLKARHKSSYGIAAGMP